MTIRVFLGYDPKEAAGYHVCSHSIITRATKPVSIQPIALNQLDWKRTNTNDKPGATDFSFARFLVPYLCDYQGYAIFLDGADMLVMDDIAKLWDMRDNYSAVQCVQIPKYEVHREKMWGQRNEWYPRKQWSAVTLWNCGHYHNRVLTPEYVAQATGAELHRFSWLDDSRIGSLPLTWNHLVDYVPRETMPSLLHFTDGLPSVYDYKDEEAVDKWYEERALLNYVMPRLEKKEAA